MSIFSKIRRRNALCCRDVNEFLAVYMDDGLDEQTRARFESHIGHCSQCAEYLDQYRATVDLVHEAEETPQPPDVLIDATLAFIRAHYGDEQDSEE